MLFLGVLLGTPCLASDDAGPSNCHQGLCERPVPEKYRQSISDAQRLGRMIFEQDEVSARATDLLYARVPEEQRSPTIRGWSTLPGPWWRVSFFVMAGKAMAVGYEINFPADQPPEKSRPTFRKLSPPRSLDADERARLDAAQTAIAAINKAKAACGTNVNPVVFPGGVLGKKGWIVYLLASTHEPGTVVQGGHQRFVISEDGRSVVSSEQLSRCGLQKVTKDTVFMALSTPFYDLPNEGHVFSSLSTRLGFFLQTPVGVWEVEGEAIKFFSRPDGKAPEK
jgi:hypothetical protein